MAEQDLVKTFGASLKVYLARHRRIGGELAWVGIGQAAAVIGGLVTVRVLTGILAPVQYGELALGMTAATLIQQVAFAGTNGATMRFFTPAVEKSQLGAFLRGTWSLLLGRTALMAGVAVLGFAGLWLTGNLGWSGLAVAAFSFALLTSYSGILDGMQNAARQRAIVAFHQGLDQWLRLLIAVALIYVVGSSSSAVIWGYALASILVLVSQSLFFRVKIQRTTTGQGIVTKENARYWARQMSVYGWPFASWGLFYWLQVSSDRWALGTFGGTAEVGLYAVLFQLGYYPITLLYSFVAQLVTPVLFNRAGDASDRNQLAQARRLNLKLLVVTLISTAVAVLIAYCFHQRIFSLLAAPAFGSVSGLLPVMVLAGGLFASGQVACLFSLSGTDTRVLIAPKIGTAVLAIVLNISGAYLFGVTGVVCAGVIYSLVYLLWVLRVTRSAADANVSQSLKAVKEEIL